MKLLRSAAIRLAAWWIGVHELLRPVSKTLAHCGRDSVRTRFEQRPSWPSPGAMGERR